jgi:hypothetical protein
MGKALRPLMIHVQKTVYFPGSMLDLQARSQQLYYLRLYGLAHASAEQWSSIASEAKPAHVHEVRDRL